MHLNDLKAAAERLRVDVYFDEKRKQYALEKEGYDPAFITERELETLDGRGLCDLLDPFYGPIIVRRKIFGVL